MTVYVVAKTKYEGDSTLEYKANPKRVHGKAYARYEEYKSCETIAEYFELMNELLIDGESVKKYARADLNYDFMKGHVLINGLAYEGEE